MKILLILVLVTFQISAAAQHSKSTTKSISDDGKTLKLRYEIVGSGQSVQYSNEFEVTGWSKLQKEQLVTHIIDSLTQSGSSRGDYLHKKINDNGKIMTVLIEGRRKGTEITYTKSFDVAGKTEAEKKVILEEVLKSLGLNQTNQ